MPGPKVIQTKKVGNIEYRLTHWESDGLFVINKFDTSVKQVQRLPKVFESDDKEKALDFLENLE